MAQRARSSTGSIAWSPVLLLGGLAALTYWLDAQVQPPPPRRDGSARHDPDLFVEDFRAVSFDARRPAARRRSRRSAREHYPDDETHRSHRRRRSSLTEPGKPRVPVTADARQRSSGDREHAYLHRQRARRRASADDPRRPRGESRPGRVTLTTEYLHVMPKEERARDRPGR